MPKVAIRATGVVMLSMLAPLMFSMWAPAIFNHKEWIVFLWTFSRVQWHKQIHMILGTPNIMTSDYNSSSLSRYSEVEWICKSRVDRNIVKGGKYDGDRNQGVNHLIPKGQVFVTGK